MVLNRAVKMLQNRYHIMTLIAVKIMDHETMAVIQDNVVQVQDGMNIYIVMWIVVQNNVNLNHYVKIQIIRVIAVGLMIVNHK